MTKRDGRSMLKLAGWLILVGFYIFAGFNHFRDPDFYYPLIPPYLPFPELINTAAGIFEIAFGMALIFTPTRRLGAILIVLMLIAFIPAHVYFIELGGCLSEGLCVPAWVAWVRLIIIHPLLIWWAWSYRNYKPTTA